MDNAEFDTIGRSLEKSTRNALEATALVNKPPSQPTSNYVKLPEQRLHPLVTKYQIDKSWYQNDSVLGYPESHEREVGYQRGALHQLDNFYVRSLAEAHAERTAKMTDEEKNQLYGDATEMDESTTETDKTPVKIKSDRVLYTAPDSVLSPLPNNDQASLADVIRVQDPTAPPTAQDVYVSAYLSDIWKQNREREAMLDRARAHGKACSEQWVCGLTDLGEEAVRRQEARMSTAPRVDLAMNAPQRRERVAKLVHSMQSGSQSAASQRVGAQDSEYAGNVDVRVAVDETLSQSGFPALQRGVGAFTAGGMPASRPVTTAQLGRAGAAAEALPADAAARYQSLELWSATMQTGKGGQVLTAQAWPQVNADKAVFAAAVKTQQARAAAAAKPPRHTKQRPRSTATGDDPAATLTSGRATMSTTELGRPAAAITKQPAPSSAALLAAAPTSKPGPALGPGAPAALPSALAVIRVQALSQVHQALHRRLVVELNAAAAAERELRAEQDEDEDEVDAYVAPPAPLVSDLTDAMQALEVSEYTLSPLRPLAASTTLSRRIPRASLSTHDSTTGSVVRSPYDYDAALTATAQAAVAPAAGPAAKSSIRRVGAAGTARLPPAGLTSAAFAAQRAAQRQQELDEERRRIAEDPNALAEFDAEHKTASSSPTAASAPASVPAQQKPLEFPPDQLEALMAAVAVQPSGAAAPAARPAEPTYAPLALSTKTYVLDKAPPPRPPADPADARGRSRGMPKRPGNDGPRAGRRAAAPAPPPLAHTFGAVVLAEPLRPVLTTPAPTYQVVPAGIKTKDTVSVGVGVHRAPVTVLNRSALASPHPEMQQRQAVVTAARMERDAGLKDIEALRTTLAQNRVVVNHKALEQALVPPPNVLSAEDRYSFAPQMAELVEDPFTAAAKAKGKRRKVKSKQ